MFESITEFIISLYANETHDYSLSTNEFISSIVTILLLFFIFMVIAVFSISTVFLIIKLHRCEETDEEKQFYEGEDDTSDDESDVNLFKEQRADFAGTNSSPNQE